MSEDSKNESEFESAHSETTVVGELYSLIKGNRKFWMIPIFVVMLLLGMFVALGGTAVAPFIYTLF